MLLSQKHAFIFVHICKTGGLSVQKSLRRFAPPPLPTWMYGPLRWVGKSRLRASLRCRHFAEHITARQLQEQLPPTVFDRYFKFAFVRNPWDLEVSSYHYVLQHPAHRMHQKFKAMNGFAEYIRWRVRCKARLQKDYVVDQRGELLVDFVGRFEQLSTDFEQVCNAIGIRAHLPHANSSSHRDYRSYYDRATATLLKDVLRADIDFFGFQFDGPAAGPIMRWTRRAA